MEKRVIILCYRKIIRPGNTNAWDRLVYEDSYMEFKMQAQNFTINTPYTTYAELLRHLPDAQKLPAMVTPAITGYIQQLGSVMPDILNSLGRRFLRFDRFVFEIINSDITDRDKHHIAINFYSAPVLWHATVNDQLLTSIYNGQQQPEPAEILTDMFQLQPYLSIFSLKDLNHE